MVANAHLMNHAVSNHTMQPGWQEKERSSKPNKRQVGEMGACYGVGVPEKNKGDPRGWVAVGLRNCAKRAVCSHF